MPRGPVSAEAMATLEAPPDPPAVLTPPRDAGLNLEQRMLTVMANVGYIPKLGTGPQSQGSYAFARDADIRNKVREECISAGVMLHVSMYGRDFQVLPGTNAQGQARSSVLATVWGTLEFVNVDDPTQRVTIECHGQGIDSQDKAISKATTSAVKYGLLNAFVIPTGDDPDAAGEDVPYQQPQQARPAPAYQGPDDGDPGYGGEPARPQQAQPVPSGPGTRCPKHDRAWRNGQYGWHCTAKDESTERGYCSLKPDAAFIASQER